MFKGVTVNDFFFFKKIKTVFGRFSAHIIGIRYGVLINISPPVRDVVLRSTRI
jgi:hypothetical protein